MSEREMSEREMSERERETGQTRQRRVKRREAATGGHYIFGVVNAAMEWMRNPATR